MPDAAGRGQGAGPLKDLLDHAENIRLDSGPLEGGVLRLKQLDELVAEHLLEVR